MSARDNTLARVLASGENLIMDTPALPLVHITCTGGVCTITLDDPSRRNALGTALFEQFEHALAQAHETANRGEIIVVVIRATGRAFCSGFDLAQCVQNHETLAQFVRRLAAITRVIREMPAIVVAQVQGAALAGGCAIVAACDIVCASEQATFGYPVHRIGISPAVSLPTLMATVGCGGARTLTLSGEIVDARRAKELGLVFTLSPDADMLDASVAALARELSAKPPAALRATKAWLNHVDGTHSSQSLGSRAHDVTEATAALAATDESRLLLAHFWNRRKGTD